MWHITELIPYIEKPNLEGNLKTRPPRLFFAIYYRVKDNAFRKAAKTWLDTMQIRYPFDRNDRFIEKEVSSEEDFKSAWHEIYVSAIQAGSEVFAGNILTHSSKQDDRNDGLEFSEPEDSIEDGTLHHSEIVALKRLPWAKNGFLILSGCNTGLAMKRKWAPAFSFALIQRVPTVGQAGYAYFSTSWSTYGRTSAGSKETCLWAYKRSGNSSSILLLDFTPSTRMSGIVFKV
jgi:hypothetical protein